MGDDGLELEGDFNGFTLGRNHEDMNVRDRIVHSTFLRKEKHLLILRVVLLVLSLIPLAAGIFLSFRDEDTFGDSDVQRALLLCRIDLFAWLSFPMYLVFSILATRRVLKFEDNIEPGMLQVEIYQSNNNFFQQKLTRVERAAVVTFALSFILVTSAFAYSISLFVREDEDEFNITLETLDNPNIRPLVIDTTLFILMFINFLFSRQILNLWHFILAIAIGIIFLGENAGCSIGFDVNVYEDLIWTGELEVTDTVYQSLGAVGVSVAAWIVGRILQFFREKYYYAYY